MLFASIHGIGTKNLHCVAACMAEEIITKDKGSTHNNKECIPDDQRNKERHTYVFRIMQDMEISGDIFPLNYVPR